MAQSDVLPTGDHSLSSADSKGAVVSFWRKNVHTYWLIAYRTKPVQKNV